MIKPKVGNEMVMQNIDVTIIRTVEPNRDCNAEKTDFQVERKNVFAFDFSCVFLFFVFDLC